MNATSEQIKSIPDSKPTRLTIIVEIEGFPIAIEVEGKADALKSMVKRLKAIGAQPPQPKSSFPNSSFTAQFIGGFCTITDKNERQRQAGVVDRGDFDQASR
jgi:hypothetical protein